MLEVDVVLDDELHVVVGFHFDALLFLEVVGQVGLELLEALHVPLEDESRIFALPRLQKANAPQTHEHLSHIDTHT